MCESSNREAIELGGPWLQGGSETAMLCCTLAINIYFPCLFSRADIEHYGVQPESLSYHSKLKWLLFPKVKAAILQAQKLSNFSPQGSLFLSGLSDRETRKLSRARGTKRRTLRGARMPEQRRAGQLVDYSFAWSYLAILRHFVSTHCQGQPGRPKLAGFDFSVPNEPAFTSSEQRRVPHDLVVVDDWQETKWRWMAK